MTVRTATIKDAEQMAILSGQLGYPSTAAETARRLDELRSNREHAAMVADEKGLLLGWVPVLISHSLVAIRGAEIGALVVDQQHRRRGVGRALMAAAEEWACGQNCISVRLHSNVMRQHAHTFYEGLGYREAKLQKVFCKDLK